MIISKQKEFVTEYLDHGDNSYKCGLCNAKLWHYESLNTRKAFEKTTYSMCCSYGKVELPSYKDAEPSYMDLFRSSNEKSKYFIKNIRRYNSMFSFTSMGGRVDHTINKGKAPFIYKLSGQNYHRTGSLLPPKKEKPSFCQLYIYDTEHEVENRQKAFK